MDSKALEELALVIKGLSKDKKKEEKDDKPHVPTTLALNVVNDKTVELWRSPGDIGYITFQGNGWESWPIRSERTIGFLRSRYFGLFKQIAPPSLIENVVEELNSYCLKGKFYKPEVRVTDYEGKIYLNMCDERWRVLEVDSEGWRLLDKSPVPFIRQEHSLPYVVPQRGGNIDILKKYLHFNSHGDETFKLLVAFILSAFRPSFEYPILMVNGQQDSGKTTLTTLLMKIIDPYGGTPSRMPKTENDIGVAALNRHLVSYDNLSSLNGDLSDAICCLSTGYTATLRKLFTNGELYTYTIHRPVVLNGIPSLASRDDFARRTIGVHLKKNGGEKMDMKSLFAKFEEDLPLIFGAILDLLSTAMKNIKGMKIPPCDGLIGVAQWTEASGVFEEGEFVRLYNKNREELIMQVMESDDLARLILDMMKDSHHKVYTYDKFVSEASFLKKGTIFALKSARLFYTQVERIRPALAKCGIEVVDLGRDKSNNLKQYRFSKIVV